MTVPIDSSLAESLDQSTTPTERINALFAYMQQRGQSNYDESVTQLEHALQAAFLARATSASPESVTAALLHDIGHFLIDEQDDFHTQDWHHEALGAEHIGPYFVDAVTEPIRLHVAAKRYLCTVDPSYHHGLSPASQHSLTLQGGTMSSEEVSAFEDNPYHAVAVLLRRWDDGAKVPGLKVPALESYRQDIEVSFSAGSSQ